MFTSRKLSMHFTHYNRHICDESGDRWDLPIRKGNNVEMVVEDEHPAEGYVLDVRGRVRIVKFNGERHTLGKTERILKAGDTLKILRVDHIDDTLLEDVA